jgi:hypothetical protein
VANSKPDYSRRSVSRFRLAYFLLNVLYLAIGSLTGENRYNDPIALGAMLGVTSLLNWVNTAFDFNPQGGPLVVDMLAAPTTATPTLGTFATQKTNNVLTSLTSTSAETTLALTPSQIDASFATGASMERVSLKHGDALLQILQANIIAGLKAATIGISITNTVAGWIDNLIPAAATEPDIINQIIAPHQQIIERVRANNAGGSDSDLVLITTPVALSRLKAACRKSNFTSLWFRDSSGAEFFDGIQVFAIAGTNFGSASNEYAFVIHKTSYALKFTPPYVWGGGWQDGPDIQRRWTTVCAYAYGAVETTLLAGELVNAAT